MWKDYYIISYLASRCEITKFKDIFGVKQVVNIGSVLSTKEKVCVCIYVTTIAIGHHSLEFILLRLGLQR